MNRCFKNLANSLWNAGHKLVLSPSWFQSRIIRIQEVQEVKARNTGKDRQGVYVSPPPTFSFLEKKESSWKNLVVVLFQSLLHCQGVLPLPSSALLTALNFPYTSTALLVTQLPAVPCPSTPGAAADRIHSFCTTEKRMLLHLLHVWKNLTCSKELSHFFYIL